MFKARLNRRVYSTLGELALYFRVAWNELYRSSAAQAQVRRMCRNYSKRLAEVVAKHGHYTEF